MNTEQRIELALALMLEELRDLTMMRETRLQYEVAHVERMDRHESA